MSSMAKESSPVANGESLDSSVESPVQCDVLVVGAGFSGITALHRLRTLGLHVKCFESGTNFGGVWYWNRYPGARVDCEIPYYQLNIPEVYNTWNFSQKFPDHKELRKYIHHIDKTLGLRKDVVFDAKVNGVKWDASSCKWHVTTQQGHTAKAKYLLLCTGALHQSFIPEFHGIDSFQGELYHTSSYPEDLSIRGKKVILVGAGATAVQVTQEVGKEADHLTVLVRRPSHCLPMRQRHMSVEEQNDMKFFLASIFDKGRDTFGGFHTKGQTKGTMEVSEEERQAVWENADKIGSFNYFLSTFPDAMLDKEANRAFYDFWAKKTQLRLTDPKKQKIMCPDEPTNIFLGKRPPLEQDYYEVLNQPNVDVVDISSNKIGGFHEHGVFLADGTKLDADIVILATGFDAFRGSLTNMGLKDKHGKPIEDIWQDGISTYLSFTFPGFPNMFVPYNAQSPAPLSNGTTLIEAQIETIRDMIGKLENEHVKSIEAKQSAAAEWAASIDAVANMTLYPLTDSWWDGQNIPGRKRQNLTYLKGINVYEKECRDAMDGWNGFDIK